MVRQLINGGSGESVAGADVPKQVALVSQHAVVVN